MKMDGNRICFITQRKTQLHCWRDCYQQKNLELTLFIPPLKSNTEKIVKLRDNQKNDQCFNDQQNQI